MVKPYDFTDFFDESNILTAKKGTLLQTNQTQCSNFLLVQSGTIRVYALSADSRENTLYRISNNETCIITTSCLISDRPFPALAEAETDVKIRFMPKVEFHRLFHHSETFRQRVFELLSQRIGVLVDTISLFGTFSIEQRLSKILLKNKKSG